MPDSDDGIPENDHDADNIDNDSTMPNIGSNNDTDDNSCQPIVSALLTFVISLIHNSSDPKLIELIGRYFDFQQVKDAKHVLCDAGNEAFKRRQDSEYRLEKMAHTKDIVDILRKLDRANKLPFFVVDGIGLAGLPRVHPEDISYVTVAEKITDLIGKMDILNDAMAANTVRSLDNEQNIKHLESRHMSYSSVMKAQSMPSQSRDVVTSPTRGMPPTSHESVGSNLCLDIDWPHSIWTLLLYPYVTHLMPHPISHM